MMLAAGHLSSAYNDVKDFLKHGGAEPEDIIYIMENQ